MGTTQSAFDANVLQQMLHRFGIIAPHDRSPRCCQTCCLYALCLQYTLQSYAISGVAQILNTFSTGIAVHVARACWVVLMQKALLQGGWMSYRTPEDRIRVNITNKPLMLVDLTIQGQSGRCDVTFQPA